MPELARAIDEADWPRALALALDAWRASRSPIYADLVDRIALRCPSEPVPRERVQRWWMQRAKSYDPVLAIPLLANAADLARRNAGNEKRLFERIDVLVKWPDDPRVARVLARWFVSSVGWMYAHDKQTPIFYKQIAASLVVLRDTRVIPELEQALAEPRGLTVGLRELQTILATQTIDALASVALVTVPLEIASWVPAPAIEPATHDERTLWLDAAESDGARLVLADFLLERGDRRGEIITLACTGDADNMKRSSALLHEHWERWMGELALVLDRGFCTFSGGLLDVASVGVYGTPEWAYPKVVGHRELSTIRTVRPGWNASERGYVAFLDALPRLPLRVRLMTTMIELLARARARWPIRVFELVTNLPDLRTPLRDAIALAARVMPDVEEIDLPMPGELDHAVLDAIVELPRLFPRLARVRVDAARRLPRELRDALLTLADAHPFVEVDHGHYLPRGTSGAE